MLSSLFYTSIIASALLVGIDAAPAPKPLSMPLRRAIDHPNLAKRGVSSHQLWNFPPTGYLIDVQLGTPPQTFTVTIDTGSSDLWVPSSACTAATGCPGKTFDATQSSTFQNTSQPFNMVYGLGSDNGTYVKDVVRVGEYSIPDQIFALVDSAMNTTRKPSDHPYLDGILGMAWDSGTYGAVKGTSYSPFMYSLYKSGQIPSFSYALHLGGLYAKGYSGTVTFGGVDQSLYTGSLQTLKAEPETYGNITSYQHWAVYAQSFKLTQANQEFSFQNGPELVVLDSGSSFTYLPSYIVEGILATIAPQAQKITNSTYSVPCSLQNSTEFFEISFPNSKDVSSNPVSFQVPVKDMVIGYTDGNNTQCMFGISSQGGFPIYLLGDTVLRNWYVSFDFQKKQVGIAQAVVQDDTPYMFNINDLQ